MYKGIIFDLDGVICHTDKYHYRAWKKIAQELGIPFDEQSNNRMRGVSRRESLEIMLEQYPHTLSEEDKQHLAEKKNSLYREYLTAMTEKDLSPETAEILYKLKDNQYLIAIGSSSKNAGIIIEKLGLDGFFDAVVDGNQIVESKPHPEVFLKAATALGLSTDECLVVEDAAAGIEAAYAGNFACAGLGEAAAGSHTTYPIMGLLDLCRICEI